MPELKKVKKQKKADLFLNYLYSVLTGCLILGVLYACQSSSPVVSTSPTPSPSVTAPGVPTEPSPSLSTNASSTPSPLPSPTSELGPFSGLVLDTAGQPVEDVTVRARSLNSLFPYDRSTQTKADGSYSFADVPIKVQVELSTSKPNYAPRRQVVLKFSSVCGDPDLQFHFGKASSCPTGYNPKELALEKR